MHINSGHITLNKCQIKFLGVDILDTIFIHQCVCVEYSNGVGKSAVNIILQGSFNQANLEKLDKAVVGLRKDEVDNVNGDDLANALDNMKDTISEVMVDMDDTTIAAMVEKVNKEINCKIKCQ